MRVKSEERTGFIATVYNERENIHKLLDSLISQSKSPNEIIIVDAGSTDGTIDILNGYKKKFGMTRFKLLIRKGNRSVGRNTAVRDTKSEIIAVSDADCVLDKYWFERITQRFEDKSIDVVAGYYKPVTNNAFEKALSTYTCVMPDKVTEDFLPSSRSVAFRKSAWKKVGGYPENLDTCEDLVFARKLKNAGLKFAVVRNATVIWPQRKNLKEAFIQFFNYAKGDGKAWYIRPQTPLLFARYLFGVMIFAFAILSDGYLYILLAILLVLYLLWAVFKNFKYIKGKSAFFFLPLLQLTSDIAVLAGTTYGFFQSLFKNRQSNTSAAIFGAGWLGGAQLGVRVLTFLKFAVIIRLLTPLEFGVYSLTVMVLGLTEIFTEIGIQQFLIQKKNAAQYVNSAFGVAVLRGFVLLFIIILLSAPLSFFFNEPQIVKSLYIVSFIPLIKGFTNPNIFYFQKRLQFHKDVLLKMTGVASDAVLSILFVFLYGTVFVLFLSLVIATIIEVAFSFLVIRIYPKFSLHWAHIKSIFSFSKWIVTAGSLHYFTMQIDSLIIGRILGVSLLGVYQAAQRFSLRIMTESGDIPAKISYPIFSNLQSERIKFLKGVKKTLISVAVFWGLISISLILFTDFIVYQILRLNLDGVTELFRIFVLIGFIQVIMGIITSALLSMGNQKTIALLVLARMLILIILAVPFLKLFGLIGVSIASLFSVLATLPFGLSKVLQK